MINSGELVTRVFGPIRAMGPRVIVRPCRSGCIANDTIFLAYFSKNPALVSAKSCFRKPKVCPSCEPRSVESFQSTVLNVRLCEVPCKNRCNEIPLIRRHPIDCDAGNRHPGGRKRKQSGKKSGRRLSASAWEVTIYLSSSK